MRIIFSTDLHEKRTARKDSFIYATAGKSCVVVCYVLRNPDMVLRKCQVETPRTHGNMRSAGKILVPGNFNILTPKYMSSTLGWRHVTCLGQRSAKSGRGYIHKSFNQRVTVAACGGLADEAPNH